MSQHKVYLLSWIIAAVLLLLPPGPRLARAITVRETPALSCGPIALVPSPSPGSFNGLNGVAAISLTNMVAVGFTLGAIAGDGALTERYDGAAWSALPTPSPLITSGAYLSGVAAVPPSTYWAVGQSVTGTLILQGNGQGWRVVPSPNAAGASEALQGVAAHTARDMWAVGWADQATTTTVTFQPLAEHWDGTQWSIVPVPSVVTASDDNLFAVAAVPGTAEAWAVGAAATGPYAVTAPLIEHWDGTQWSVVPSPDLGAGSGTGGILLGVSFAAANDGWAVGNMFSVLGGRVPLAEHWDGTQWTVVPTPALSAPAEFAGITAWAGHAVAVGSIAGSVITSPLQQSLVEAWNGTTWSIVPSPNAAGLGTVLTAVTHVLGSGQAVAVGYTLGSDTSQGQTVIESNCQ